MKNTNNIDLCTFRKFIKQQASKEDKDASSPYFGILARPYYKEEVKTEENKETGRVQSQGYELYTLKDSLLIMALQIDDESAAIKRVKFLFEAGNKRIHDDITLLERQLVDSGYEISRDLPLLLFEDEGLRNLKP